MIEPAIAAQVSMFMAMAWMLPITLMFPAMIIKRAFEE